MNDYSDEQREQEQGESNDEPSIAERVYDATCTGSVSI